MKNEVYGEAKLDISIPVEANEETLGLLEANYKLDTDRITHIELTVTTIDGKIHTVRVHNLDVNLDKFTDE